MSSGSRSKVGLLWRRSWKIIKVSFTVVAVVVAVAVPRWRCGDVTVTLSHKRRDSSAIELFLCARAHFQSLLKRFKKMVGYL